MPRQSSHSKVPPPPWLGLVKRAIVVMSVLIVVGLGLLVYGVVNQIGRLSPTAVPFSQAVTFADAPADGIMRVLRIPQGLTLIASNIMADGRVMLRFASYKSGGEGGGGKVGSGEGEIIILSPDLQSIVARLRLLPHDDSSAGDADDFILDDAGR
ncbi:MAG: hypothetical protein MJE68_05405 [Proteobacteria bacterium]|nr:hypothetical protein [Pseudomonadota bacterium]